VIGSSGDLVIWKHLPSPSSPDHRITRSPDSGPALFLLFSGTMATRNKTRGTPTISLVGSGNLAQVLGPALRAAGHRITSIAYRKTAASKKRAGALAVRLATKPVAMEAVMQRPAGPDIVWLCHTDDALPETARILARQPHWKGKIVFHSSGALTSDVLAPLQRAGAHAASLHPMMTFVPGTQPRLKGIPFAVEGDRQAVAAARRIVGALGAEVFAIRKDKKVLYHALGSFSSPLLVATLATAERVGLGAGLSREQTRKIIAPILQQTLRNYLDRSAAAAFSGPIKRGDLNTVRRHLRELKRVPEAREAYRALLRSAVRDLPSRRRQELLRAVAAKARFR
jgi:predicted short-subunit dehydrogenase-like oxidoreductase (DUF2520 family)